MKQVFGVGKIGDVGELKNKLAHVTRQRENGEKYKAEHIDEKLDKYNKIEIAHDPQQGMARFRDALEGAKQYQYKNKRNVIASDVILGASPEFADKNTREGRKKWQELLEAQVDFFKQKHGEKNVLAVAYHYDEPGSPHAHVLAVPRMTRELKKGPQDYISHTHFYGDPRLGSRENSKLFKLHTEFHQAVSTHYGLDRGTPNSRARHQDVKKFRTMVNEHSEKRKQKPEVVLAQAMEERQKAEHTLRPVRELEKKLDEKTQQLNDLQRENSELRIEKMNLEAERSQARVERDWAREETQQVKNERDDARGKMVAYARQKAVPFISSEIQREWMQSGKSQSAEAGMSHVIRQQIQRERGMER